MAGPLTIQRFPASLLTVLGSQVGGDTPHELSPAVVGVVPLLDMYLRDRLTVFQGGTFNPGPAAGYVTLLGSLPQTEIWYVYGATVDLTQAAATTGRYQLCVAYQLQSANAVYVPIGPTKSLAAGDLAQCGAYFDTPIFLRSGDGFVLSVENYTGAVASQAILRCAVARCQGGA